MPTQRKSLEMILILSNSIRFFADFSQKNKNRSGILVITDSQLLYIVDFKELKYQSELRNVVKCEVFEEKLTIKKSAKIIQNVIEPD
jgi:hypothetical protein